jgi:hypothetical protein
MMRNLKSVIGQFAACTFLACSCLAQSAAPAPKPENPGIAKIESMKARAEKMGSGDRARIYSVIARELVEVANQQFVDGEVEKAQNSIKEAVAFSDKSVTEAQVKGKKIKNTEITLRETARRIDEVRRTIAVDDQPPLAEAVLRIEEMRRKLLDHMFGAEKK